MDKALASFAPYAYAILRLIAGLLFISHSGQKLSLAGSAGIRCRSLHCSASLH